MNKNEFKKKCEEFTEHYKTFVSGKKASDKEKLEMIENFISSIGDDKKLLKEALDESEEPDISVEIENLSKCYNDLLNAFAQIKTKCSHEDLKICCAQVEMQLTFLKQDGLVV